MDEQQRHSTSDSSSGSSGSSATGAMAASAPPSLSSPSAAAPRSTLQRILSTTLHDDPTLSAIRRALPPLPLPPEPQPTNPMLIQQQQQQQQPGAGGGAGGVAAAAAGEEANAKESLIQSMLKRPPFGALGDKHYRSTVLRDYLHELPHAQLFQLAWHWSFYCDHRLHELKGSRKRPVSTWDRAWIERFDSDGKNHAMRPFTFLTNLLQADLKKQECSLAQRGSRLLKADMDGWIGLVLQLLAGRFLLPATLVVDSHLWIRDDDKHGRPASAAVAFLQQLLREAGVDLDPKEFKWSLVYLLEQACDLALPPTRAAAIIGQLCNLLVQEGVHVPMQPLSTIKEFVLRLLWCNMLVEYSDALNFERWLRQQGHPLADLSHLREQQTATAEAMRSTPMLAQTVSRLDSAFVGPIAASSSCSAPPVSSSQFIAPAAGDAAAGGPVIASDSRSNSAPLMPSMPQSLRTASDYLPSPPPLLDQAAADPSMVAADVDLTLRSSSPLGVLPSLEFDDRDLDQLMDSSNQ